MSSQWEGGGSLCGLVEPDPAAPGYERTVCGAEIECGKKVIIFSLLRPLTTGELAEFRRMITRDGAVPVCCDDTSNKGECHTCARLGGCPVVRAMSCPA